MTQPANDISFSNTSELLQQDRRYIWHPYSRFNSDLPIFPVNSAKGTYLELSTGERIYDGMSSWWSTIHGYNHPVLNQAVHDQTDKMSHVMFGGLTHEPAIKLAKLLADITPEGLSQVFFSDSGSVAVEVALKMAIQYWNSLGQDRHKFLTLKRGYHGDTFGAMSVCDPVTGMHQLFSGFLQQNIFADAPECGFDEDWNERHFENFRQLAQQHHHEIAAVILEPIVQGTGGMRFYSPHFLTSVRKVCDQYNILLIADEIATGFARTGKLFACEHANITPDIMCLGKALTGGYMSMAATLCSDHVANTICQGEAGVFMHGPTFMANPLACAVAYASIELLLKSQWQNTIKNIERWLNEGLSPCINSSLVNNVRVLGAIGVVELHEPVDMKIIQPMFVEEGIWLRPFGKLIYSMPPYISSQDDIIKLSAAIERVLTRYKSAIS